MNTREIAVEYRLAHWAKTVQDRSESGLSIKAYCESLSIHENTYYYWLRKLREAACGELTKIEGKPVKLANPVFAEVKLPVEAGLLPGAAIPQQGNICIEVAGARISADCEYPIDKLAEVLRAVKLPCC